MTLRFIRIFVIASIFLLTCVAAQGLMAGETTPQVQRPKVVLVLSGGGARGAAHVGVIRQLEALRIPIDMVVGTSMGATIGSLYAAGYSADQMELILEQANWLTIFSDTPPRDKLWFRRRQDDRIFQVDMELGWHDGEIIVPPGFIIGLNAEAYFENLLLPVETIKNFDDFPIPFRCIATDADSGEAFVFSQGKLATAVRASMSIPGIFAPIEYQGHILIDGGVIDNFPIKLAQTLGADIIIAVDISEPENVETGAVHSAMGVFNQMLTILSAANQQAALEALRPQDILITPDVAKIGIMDFTLYAEGIEAGAQATIAKQQKLTPLSVDVETYRAWRSQVVEKRKPLPLIRNVRIDGKTGLSDKVLKEHITIKAGEPLTAEKLKQTREQLAGIGIFEHINIDVESSEEVVGNPPQTDVIIKPMEKSWGSHYFRFGIGVSSDFQGGGEFDIGLQHTWTPINGLGGEWRNEIQIGTRGRLFSEFYQPVDYGLRWFVAPYAAYEYDTLPIIINQTAIAEYDLDAYSAGLFIGRNLGYWGEIRTGYGYLTGTAKPRILPPGISRDTIELTEYIVSSSLIIDTLDSTILPQHGFYGDVKWELNSDEYDMHNSKSVLSGSCSVPATYGAFTLLTSLEAGSTLDEDSQFGSKFYLGGFRRLSGLVPRELNGEHLLLGVLQATYQLSERTTLFGIAPFVGATIEAGNVWLDRHDMNFDDLNIGSSLFLGSETIIGQGYLGAGYTENNNFAVYLFIGPIF